MMMTRSPRFEIDNVGKSVPESGYWLEWYSSSLRVGLLVGEVHAKPPSHAGDGAAKATWPRYNIDIMLCWR
jgi:hypothetical protein